MKKSFALLFKLLKKTLLAFLFIVFCFSLALGFTNGGLRWMLAHVTPKNIALQGIHGHLLGTIKIDSIHYHTQQVEVTTKNVRLQWTLADLRAPKMIIQSLTASDVILTSPTLGTINLTPLTIQGGLDLFSQHASNLTVSLGGELQGSIEYNGNIRDPLQTTHIALDIKGQLHQEPLTATGALEANQNTLLLHDLAIHIGDAHALLNGTLLQHWNFQWDISVPSLEKLIPTATGQITSQGRAVAQPSNDRVPILTGTTTFQNVFFDKMRLGNLSLNIENINQQMISKLHWQEADNQVDAEWTGQFQTPTKALPLLWQGKLEKLTITTPAIKHWKLSQPTALTVSPKNMTAPNIQMISGRQSISIKNGRWNDSTKSASGDLSISKLNLSLFNSLLPEDTSLAGTLNLTAHFKNDPSATAVTLNGTINEPILTYKKNRTVFNEALEPLSISTDDSNERLTIFIRSLSSNKTIDATVTLPKTKGRLNIDSMPQAIDGHIALHFNSLSLLPALISEIGKKTKGLFDAEININGTLTKPLFSGNAHISQGNLTIPAYKLQLEDMMIDVKKKGALLTLQSRLKSGQGTLMLSGKAQADQDGFPGEYTLSGKNVTVMNTSKLHLSASPDLHIITKGNTVTVDKGRIDDVIADVSLPDKSHSFSLIPDNFINITPGNTKTSSSPIKLVVNNIPVTINKASRFRYIGIDTHIEGTVSINASPGTITTGNGELTAINGSYTGYGTQLKVRGGDGKILFITGVPLLNPRLSIKSTKTITVDAATNASTQGSNMPATPTQITVGLLVTGDIQKQIIQLIPEPTPTLSASQILAYVSSDSSSLSPTQAISGVLDTLAPKGKLISTTDSLKNALKLKTLTVGSVSETDPRTALPIKNTALIIEKNITPKLSVEYNVGLAQPINLLKLHYHLSNHFSFVSSNSTFDDGADLFWHYWVD